MNTDSKGIYHWKLGDVALARVSQKTYARVRVVKDEKGLFYDDKVLGISGKEDGSIEVTKELCYYVETCRTNHKFWLPYTSLHLAERSRPYYGNKKVSTKVEKTEVSPDKTSEMPRKRNPKEQNIAPMHSKVAEPEDPDLNTVYDINHKPVEEKKDETKYKEFLSRSKEVVFERYLAKLQAQPELNKNLLQDLLNENFSTEDKFEFVSNGVVTEKEVENYLHHCWRHNFLLKENDEEELADNLENCSMKEEATTHTPWCFVCGKTERLTDCLACPAAFHPHCKKEWRVTVIHRKNPPEHAALPETIIEKVLFGRMLKDKVNKTEDLMKVCPSCLWGPRVGFNDIVWNKLGTCSWWPARVLTPGEVPECLLAREHSANHWPIRYFGTLNHSWASPNRTCLFMPSPHIHTESEELKNAIMDAQEQYISLYLT